MAEVNFLAGKMNKDFDERVVPPGQYIDALNIRIGSSEGNSIGALENSKGNLKLTTLKYNDIALENALCIGAFENGSKETIYWFITDSVVGVDMIVSFNTNSNTLQYHVISTSVLNFDSKYLINGINLVDNILLWTDNLNPPRRINIDSHYAYPISGIDQIEAKDINVIVHPPVSSPIISLINIAGEENYMIEKFISFSYRYKYIDGEYSALSQFSEIAFEPGNFNIDYSTFDNIGMQNIFNSVNIEFNTGDKNVVGIDICFKESDSNIINVIEKYNKNKQGWPDNSTRSITFTNKKIYTTLLESELLRLYDNVPRIAKSQTIMGNRLMYGNYVDGYDIVNNNGIPIAIDYSLLLISEEIKFKEIPTELTNGINYSLDTSDIRTVSDSQIEMDFTGVSLNSGSYITFSFNLEHDGFGGDLSYNNPPLDPAPINQFVYNLTFTLQRDYLDVNDLATSPEFINAISTHVSMASCSAGYSLTDFFNCSIVPKTTGLVWVKDISGLNSTIQSFYITSSGNILKIQIPAVKYKTEDPIGSGIYLYAFEYFKNLITNVTFTLIGSKKSLHSNRDYEVAIVYMDEYNRSSTALVDTGNTIFIPAINSNTKNNIRVILTNDPPYWATKYKFVLKPSKSVYETIFTNMYFSEESGFTWFKLDGDNRSKVQDNQTLIVKQDNNGTLQELVKTKVLALESKSDNFLSGNVNPSGSEIIEPGGLYMKLKPSNFSAVYSEDSFIDNGLKKQGGEYPQIIYPCHTKNPDFDPGSPSGPGNYRYIIYDIPAGSIIKIWIHVYTWCSPSKDYLLEKQYIASQDYNNLYDFIIQQDIDLTAGISSGAGTNINYFNPTLLTWPTTVLPPYIPEINGTNQYQFAEQTDTNGLWLIVASGSNSCFNRGAYVASRIEVQRASSLIVFETEALDADGELYFEGNESYDIVGGYHMSGSAASDQNQTEFQDAVIDLNFFNCFAFGNGVESYKINDSFVGSPFYLGSRVTAVSQEDFKEADRYASITYSGIYNADTNINKLNEFNLALANWKDCEKSFGPINKLFGRKTDILTLQEDKISYVLAGKNLLSDAAGGGAITSIPEVLGTQISRIEEYGISNNPESFTVYGQDIYFTDTKRTAVINLKGGSAQSDELYPISSLGMKNWFRTEFKDSFNYQKIGGYDPYLSEYVLSLNNNLLPIELDVYPCGTTITVENKAGSYNFILGLEEVIGDVSINYTAESEGILMVILYDGIEVVNESLKESGTIIFTKPTNYPAQAFVYLTYDLNSYTMTFNCLDPLEIEVVNIVLNAPVNVNELIHNNYKWKLDTFTSPTNVDFITLQESGISLYEFNVGNVSSDVFPALGSTVSIISNKLIGDTFVFNEEINKFKYLISDVRYEEEDLGILLPLLNEITPILNPTTGVYTSSFNYDNIGNVRYLYLVWDYRVPDYSSLDYSTDYSITI